MNKISLSILTTVAGLACAGAMAQGYVGAGAGWSRLSSDCTGLSSCDKTDTGFKVFGGYRFNPNWGAELTYFDYGKSKAALVTTTVTTAEIATTGYGLGVAYFGDFAPSWRGVARFGVARMKADVSGSAGGLTASDSQSSTQAHFGLGVSYQLMKNLWLDGAADFSKSKYAGETGTVQLWSLGVSYQF